MPLIVHNPAPPLANYIALMWQWEVYHVPHPKERILPGGFMEITFSLGGRPFVLDDADGKPNAVGGAMVGGPRTEPFVIHTGQAVSLLSVVFKPGGAGVFFGVPGADLLNLHLPLETLWGLGARDLYCQLADAPTATARFHLLEAALAERLRRTAERHRAVGYALNAFIRAPGAHTVAGVIDEIALSQTRFIKVFRDDVGITPKRFCRVQRFGRAAQRMAENPTLDWVDLALEMGYYDQSHFINDFRAFAGITPTAFTPQDPDHYANLPVWG